MLAREAASFLIRFGKGVSVSSSRPSSISDLWSCGMRAFDFDPPRSPVRRLQDRLAKLNRRREGADRPRAHASGIVIRTVVGAIALQKIPGSHQVGTLP